MTNLTTTTTNPALTVIDGKPTATTRQVAERFGKRHDTVLRALAKLDCSTEFHHRNFTEVSYEVKAGNGASVSYKEYTLTRDGFAFLCMGFTGKEAAKWKEAYINEFNRMEAALAPAAPALASPYITPAQQRAIQEAVTAYVQKHQSAYGTIYSAIKSKFKVATYSQLAPADFDACMAWLEAGATVAPALPTPQSLSPLLERGTRYLVSIDDATGQLNHKPIEHDAYVMTIDRFMAVINEPGGIFVNTAKLADLAQACMKRLAGRCLHYESRALVH